MNILIDAHVFDEPHHGTRTYLKGLYSEMIQLMPEMGFFFAADDVDNLRAEFGTHANVFFLKFNQKKYLRLLYEIPRMVKQHRIDYVHFQYISTPVKNCKHIVTTHDILFKDFADLFPLKYRAVKNFLFKASARRADILLTVSEYSRDRIAYHYKIPHARIGLTPNGVSKYFAGAATGANTIGEKYGLGKFILYTSRMEPRKNHLLLLRAYRELKLWTEGYHLVFIGMRSLSYPDFDAYLENFPPDGKSYVHHISNVDNEELRAFYKATDLFVYPSLAEGFGIPPLEAVFSGADTLCSNQTAMREFTFLGDDLFDPRNLDMLKAKMVAKLTAPSSPEKKAALQEQIAAHYSWTTAAKNLIAALNGRL
jgi:glycosyltransferase involved in cell wall biosynthesis